MESSNRVCPVCSKEGHVFELSAARRDTLMKSLDVTMNNATVGMVAAYWCLSCLTPYLVLWPEVADQDVALRMAGFPPKGGVL